MTSKTKPKQTIIKWVGGKSKLLPHIIENLPANGFNNYYEPFVGGASVVLEIRKENKDTVGTQRYTVSDINNSLINTYQVVKGDLGNLIVELSKEEYSNTSESYTSKKTRFNEIKFDLENNKVERAALFIYLNKCGFNGMYRENKSGQYNIPFGKMKAPKICDKEVLSNFHNAMRDVTIMCCEYQNILGTVEKDDFVYLDPPYHDLFTDYTKNAFGEKEQQELKLFVDTLTAKGVYVMISNSATDYIKELYSDYTINILTTSYSLGGKNADRGKKSEVLITNYKKEKY